MKPRVAVFVSTYPQVSETYIKNEVDALSETHEVEILAFGPGSYPYRSRRPHIVITRENQHHLLDYLRSSFRPDVLHAHYLLQIPDIATVARQLGVPFTVRAHSFDVLEPRFTGSQALEATLAILRDSVRSPLCRGVLCFPFMRERLTSIGLPAEKVIACNPIIDVHRFRNKSPNGSAVMNVGAAIPKKNMDDFAKLSRLVPDREFNAYALGYMAASAAQRSRDAGGRVRYVAPVDPEDMCAEYKKHAWLVYTASKTENTVGWPMALIEAMASGVGVCMQNIRPDLAQYVGDAGHLFDRAEELIERISRDPPSAERERGFEWAEQFDFRRELPLLTNLW